MTKVIKGAVGVRVKHNWKYKGQEFVADEENRSGTPGYRLSNGQWCPAVEIEVLEAERETATSHLRPGRE